MSGQSEGVAGNVEERAASRMVVTSRRHLTLSLPPPAGMSARAAAAAVVAGSGRTALGALLEAVEQQVVEIHASAHVSGDTCQCA
jgi:hypothetical protein